MTDYTGSSDSPKWLKHIRKMIVEEEEEEEEEDKIDSEAIYYKIVRDMLLSEENLDKAVSEAIQKFYDYYVAGFSGGISAGGSLQNTMQVEP